MIHIKYFIICISNLQVEPELPFPSKSALAKNGRFRLCTEFLSS